MEYRASLRAEVDPTGAVSGSNQARQAIHRMGREAQSATGKLQQQQRSMDMLAKVARRATLALGGLFSAAMAQRAFATSIRMAKDYDAELSKVVGLVGVAREEVDQMGESILAMSGALGRSPQELAQGLFFVTSAGARGKQAMDILEASAKAAAAGLGDTATVADVVTSAVNAYAASGLDASRATGILVAAVREGKASAEEISSSLGQVLGLASAVGVSFDQVAASVAAMTRVGINSAEAVTSLRSTLNAIFNPSKQAAEAFNSMGLSVEGLRRQLREEGLLATMQAIGEATEGNNAKILEAIPNIRAMGAVFTLLGENAEEVQEIFESLARETGESLEVSFNEAAQTSKKQFESALASLSVELIKLGREVMPVVTDILKHLVDIMPAVSRVVKTFVKTLWDFGRIALGVWALRKSFLALNAALFIFKGFSDIGFAKAFPLVLGLMATRAKAAAVNLRLMNHQLAITAAAVAGWNIGQTLREEFVLVEVMGNELFGALQRGWNNVKYAFEAGALAIKFHFQSVFNDIKKQFAKDMRTIAAGLEFTGIAWAEDRASSLRSYADSLTATIFTEEEYRKQLAAADDERRDANKNVTDFVLLLNQEAEARNKVADAAEDQADAVSKVLTGGGSATVSFDFDEEQVEKLSQLFANMMPEQHERAELESALLFVEDALSRIEQSVAHGLPAALNGIPVERFLELRDAIGEALLDMDPLEQAARDTASAYAKLVDETRNPLEQLQERRSELYELELKMLALYPELAETIRDTVGRGLEEAEERYKAWLKTQEEGNEALERTKRGAMDLGMTFSSAFEDAVVSGGKLGDILRGLEQDIIRIIMRMLVTQPLGDALGGMFGGMFSPGENAAGGPLGRISWVGEQGRELVAQEQGAGARVLSHSDSMRIAREAMGGGNDTRVNVAPVIHIPATKVEVHQQGGGEPAQVETTEQADGSQLIRIFVNTFNKDMAQNGPMSRAIKAKYGLSTNLATR